MCDNVDRCLERLTHVDNFELAVGVSRIHVMSTALFANHQIFCFDRSQNIANYTISLAVRNDHELITSINKIIRGLIEGGLIVKWQRDNSLSAHAEFTQRSSSEAFTVEEGLIVVFFVGIPGLALAIATFCLELLIASRKLRARSAKDVQFWTKLENFVDGRRHMFKLRKYWTKPNSTWTAFEWFLSD